MAQSAWNICPPFPEVKFWHVLLSCMRGSTGPLCTMGPLWGASVSMVLRGNLCLEEGLCTSLLVEADLPFCTVSRQIAPDLHSVWLDVEYAGVGSERSKRYAHKHSSSLSSSPLLKRVMRHRKLLASFIQSALFSLGFVWTRPPLHLPW